MPRVPPHPPNECVLVDPFGKPHNNGVGHPKLHTRVPIEGAGVVHVVTDLHTAESEVVLWRYVGETATQCAHLSSCSSDPESAHDMHMYFSDLETLSLLVRGLLYVVYLKDDDYMVRKHQELFGTAMSW